MALKSSGLATSAFTSWTIPTAFEGNFKPSYFCPVENGKLALWHYKYYYIEHYEKAIEGGNNGSNILV